jgi:hypothetical protein
LHDACGALSESAIAVKNQNAFRLTWCHRAATLPRPRKLESAKSTPSDSQRFSSAKAFARLSSTGMRAFLAQRVRRNCDAPISKSVA